MTNIETLISEYQAKIDAQDAILADLKEHNANRRTANDEEGMRFARAHFHKADAVRQAYVQMVKDLEDLKN